MQFLVSVLSDSTELASDDEMAAIDVFNDGLRDGGHWIFACGLAEPDTAVVLDNRDGRALSSEGPFVRSALHVAGFWIIRAENREAALELAAAGSKACNRQVEVRELHGE